MQKGRLTYQGALRYLYGLQKYGIKFGLSKTSNLLKAFGDPHHGQNYVHIGGTNGKGSVAAMVEAILVKAGLKVGFYSSPHLVRFTERFRINGFQVADEKIVSVVEELRDFVDPEDVPTFFEMTTAMALLLFARAQTDIAIMEVGMGGRLDATNIIAPRVSVITNISLEHQAFLGHRLVDIAREKAGIIKRGVDVVTGAHQPSVIRIFESICMEKQAPLWRIGKELRYRSTPLSFNYYGLEHTFKNITLNLKGRIQHRNATLALAAIELLMGKGFQVSPQAIFDGLKNTHWPGRMQVMSERPTIILDGGHNPDAIRKLAGSIRQVFKYKRLILVLGVMEDKDIRGIIKGITPLADRTIFTRPDYYRSAQPEELLKIALLSGMKGDIEPTIPQALERAIAMADPEDLVLVCGSLFTVGEALTSLDGKNYPEERI